MTDAERVLWRVLRDRGLGTKFRRQVPIGAFIVDFVSLERHVVIEVDGGQHAERQSDRHRDNDLEERGFTVLRFWNNDVLRNLEGVVEAIREVLLHPSP